jgi:uncharacterized protein YcbX
MHISEINLYPIKSSRGISVTESRVMPRGLQWDRRWMLVDQDNRFITAREHPRLILVSTQIRRRELTAEAPGMPSLAVPLKSPTPPSQSHQSVRIWNDDCTGVVVGKECDDWFSRYLGLACRLVWMGDSDSRPVNPNYAVPGDEVSYADGFPLLLISEASLADLNYRLDKPVSMRRFRPNLVVKDTQAFAEDTWRRIRVGSSEFDVAKACSRCVMTTLDPDTGVKDPNLNPLRTLGTYRRRKEGGVYFGQNLIPRKLGCVQLGDELEVLS